MVLTKIMINKYVKKISINIFLNLNRKLKFSIDDLINCIRKGYRDGHLKPQNLILNGNITGKKLII